MLTTLSWTNPTTNVDGTPYAQTDNAGYTISLDGVGAVSIPLAWGTSFDLATLDAYKALKKGNHTVALAVVANAAAGGEESAFSSPVTFPVFSAPLPPTNLAVH